MRLSSFPLETSLQFLTLRHIPIDFTARLEVNGECIAPSETASSFLHRDKVYKKSIEVTYVSTDIVRIGGFVKFEAYDEDVLSVSGKLQILNDTFEWGMDFLCGIGGISILRRRKS